MKEGLITPTLKLHNVLIVGRLAVKGKKMKKLIKNNHSNHTNLPHVDNTHQFTNHPQRHDQSQLKKYLKCP